MIQIWFSEIRTSGSGNSVKLFGYLTNCKVSLKPENGNSKVSDRKKVLATQVEHSEEWALFLKLSCLKLKRLCDFPLFLIGYSAISLWIGPQHLSLKATGQRTQ